MSRNAPSFRVLPHQLPSWEALQCQHQSRYKANVSLAFGNRRPPDRASALSQAPAQDEVGRTQTPQVLVARALGSSSAGKVLCSPYPLMLQG